ncbi:odorant receptor 13a-like [Phymastichus coffea]|uniref:odorant receptor 13a-like n=1 Tax=Phymastichus coffea TaxID=108790 RepID=UPI00273AA755|nr:odorant receptor 13a-like [Phymastichus coffea]
MLIVVCIRLVKGIGNDLAVVIENSDAVLLTVGILTKLVMPLFYEKQRRTIYELVAKHIDSIKDENEVIVLRKFSDAGFKFSFTYMVVIASAGAVFFILPLTKMFYNYLIGKNRSETELPLLVEYVFLNKEQNFYVILVHMFMYLAACVMNDLAVDLAFIMGVCHVCTLFEIVRMRLRKASDILSRDKKFNQSIRAVNEANALLKSAIDMHNEVLHLIALLEEVYHLVWFIVLIFNTCMVGITLLEHYIALNSPLYFLRYVMAMIMFFVHFYVIFKQGQKVIDSSSSVFDECYRCNWYNAPKCSCTSLLLIMNRSVKPCTITGGHGMFVLSMETYTKMLKIGFSMFTVLKSIHNDS